MNKPHESCSQIREELLGFDWTSSDRSCATRVLQHLELCEACHQAATEFELLREAVGPTDGEPEPAGGWQAFGQRLPPLTQRNRNSTFRVFLATAASLLIALGVINLVLSLRTHPEGVPIQPIRPTANAGLTSAEQAQDVQVFHQVASVFDHRTSWVLVSDSAAEMGLTDAPVMSSGQLLLVNLTVSRGLATLSRVTLAMVPGQMAQVTVPATDGQQLSYTIQSNAADPHHISLYLEIASPASPRSATATLATNLQPEFGHPVKAGQLATDKGLYELTVGIYSERAAPPPAGGIKL